MSKEHFMESTRVYQWIGELCSEKHRPNAMNQLCERRGSIDNLGVLLWHAFGSAAALLQEIISIYPSVTQNELDVEQSERACAAISLLETIACNEETCLPLLNAQFLSYLLPLLKISEQSHAAEQLRVAVLNLVCGMLKLNTLEATRICLGTSLMPHLLRYLELGSARIKVLAANVLYHLLESPVGLVFVCRLTARLNHLLHTMARVVHQLTLEPAPLILKPVVRVYNRLADNQKAMVVMLELLPQQLRNGYFNRTIQSDYEDVALEICALKSKLDQGLCGEPTNLRNKDTH